MTEIERTPTTETKNGTFSTLKMLLGCHDGARHCLQVQEEMLKVHWREDVLFLQQCQCQVGRNQGFIFAGPRIKMGIYEGIPTRVAPHTTTGAADYFGTLVNRSAGCSTAKSYWPPGQHVGDHLVNSTVQGHMVGLGKTCIKPDAPITWC